MNKYRSQPQTYNGIRFDSKWELTTYLKIREYIPKDKILLHQKVLIKPQTHNYKPRYWKVDFIITDSKGIYRMLVEAKGLPTLDFKRQLQLIDCCEPHLIPLIRIVQHQAERIDECFSSITLEDLSKELRQLKQVI